MKLLRLEPILEGATGPESLLSYVIRLADVHGVTPQQLLRVLSGVDEAEPSAFATGPLKEILCALSGYGESTRCWIRRLAKATGVKTLDACTLIHLHGLLARNVHGMLASHRRWCPQCYRDEVAYEPLAWLLADVQTCPAHGIPLQSRCSNCNSAQHVLVGMPKRHRCESCDQPLGQSGTGSTRKPDPLRVWRETETLRIVAQRSDPNHVTVQTAIGFRCFLRAFIDPRSVKVRLLARMIGVDTSNLRRFLSGKCVPSWETVLRTGAALGVSPTDILLSPCSAGQLSFDFDQPKIYRRSRRPAPKGMREALQARLFKLMDSRPVSTPLAEVCRSLGISRSRAHHLDSQLVAYYGRLYYEWICEQRRNKDEACARVARESANMLTEHPRPLLHITGAHEHPVQYVMISKSRAACSVLPPT